MGLDVGPGLSLTALLCNPFLERFEGSDEPSSVWFPSVAFALVSPFGEVLVTSLRVAASTCGDLVLDPARSALELWNDVFGCGLDQVHVDRPSAPHTGGFVSLKDFFEARSPVRC